VASALERRLLASSTLAPIAMTVAVELLTKSSGNTPVLSLPGVKLTLMSHSRVHSVQMSIQEGGTNSQETKLASGAYILAKRVVKCSMLNAPTAASVSIGFPSTEMNPHEPIPVGLHASSSRPVHSMMLFSYAWSREPARIP